MPHINLPFSVNVNNLVFVTEWIVLAYFIGINSAYILLSFIALKKMPRYMNSRVLDNLPRVYAGCEPPISVIAPAYNEEATIASSVRSLLQLDYPEYEVIVINDGAKDRTLEVLKEEFSLEPFPEAYRITIPCKTVKQIYRTAAFPRLCVIDKENGGKADALNAGINASRFPLFCAIDADSILQRDSLYRIVQAFLEDPTTIACGATIRIANGCRVNGGLLEKVDLSRQPLALLQTVEYMRAFLAGRFGWTPFNGLLIISGAFGLFRKEAVMKVGGFRHDTIGEDMELVVRLHRTLSKEKRPYRINFIPDPLCWTEAPEDIKTLRNQRIRWQRGLGDSLMLNRACLRPGYAGWGVWTAFVFMMFFEWIGPLIEFIGYFFMPLAYFFNLLSTAAFIAFLLAAFGLGMLASVCALLLEELSFHTYPGLKNILILFGVAIAENLGYRQIVSYWRLKGFLQWVFRRQAKWGEMKRTASWQADTPASPETKPAI